MMMMRRRRLVFDVGTSPSLLHASPASPRRPQDSHDVAIESARSAVRAALSKAWDEFWDASLEI
eukprot:1243674-Pyramimonas_sp.AAC.1